MRESQVLISNPIDKWVFPNSGGPRENVPRTINETKHFQIPDYRFINQRCGLVRVGKEGLLFALSLQRTGA